MFTLGRNRCSSSPEYANGFKRKDIEYPLFVKTPSGEKKLQPVLTKPLVMHSFYESKKEDLERNLSGVQIDWGKYFHNSNINGFEKKFNKGKKKTYFGLFADIESEKVVEDLVAWLSGKLIKVKHPASEIENIKNAEPELKMVPETVREALVQARSLLDLFEM